MAHLMRRGKDDSHALSTSSGLALWHIMALQDVSAPSLIHPFLIRESRRAGAEPDEAPVKDRCVACNNMDLRFLI